MWDHFDPDLMTLCSPDPQAFRPPEDEMNVLQVRLPTNFKSARFDSDAHTALLRELADGIEAARFEANGAHRAAGEAQGARLGLRAARQVGDAARRQLPLRAGRERALDQGSGARQHRRVARRLPLGRGPLRLARAPTPATWCPFEKYANAALSLGSPSSAARALAAGAPYIERVDRLVQSIAAQQGRTSPIVDDVVAKVDAWLVRNRRKG